ncbi:hypothetical protein LTS07_002753 [Exophiala sideris]|uniref:Clr5 domain-containing protein n=1 Tax=Exophiala sideris TaxID=1016849 RepID=A0ABR0JLU8_9EURO|nr:hypothetical protein LTS07_002753 [Exophiala sideris]KAK5039332.1 hypothetical protein LTR13_003589 [Exophiala sideris]KAK5066241.1 hypothetical protein LTR69_002759 [Exophiala sideris]KAK5186918.1 hypothetical protein LTR44_000924 [Eurotiomycetes sp. CCFEE 6388]
MAHHTGRDSKVELLSSAHPKHTLKAQTQDHVVTARDQYVLHASSGHHLPEVTRTPSRIGLDLMQERQWQDPEGSTKDYCTCTLKDDGWLCLDCKDLQNWEAISTGETRCHGQGCGTSLDADKERRRICLWCDKALPRQIGGTTRHHWNNKLVEARARNAASRQADMEEYNRKRLKLLTMSRREMRGDFAVKDDPDADTPQFVRHLDTLNYRSYMEESVAPSGDSVYDSKRGYWRYSVPFLLAMRTRCEKVPAPPELATFNQKDDGALCFARTNSEKMEDVFLLTSMAPSMPEERLNDWCNLKAVILELLLVQKMSYETTQKTIGEEYDFWASIKAYRKVLNLWYSQGQIGKYRRGSSVDREDDTGSPNQSSNDGGGLERIPTIDSDLASIAEEPQLRQTTTASSCSSTFTDAAKDVFSLKKQRERRSSSRAPPLIDQTSPVRSRHLIEAATHTTTDTQFGNTTAEPDINPPAIDEENPPPYTPDGWIWP